jgi:hypothetical protein
MMGIRAIRASNELENPSSLADRDEARLLALLGDDRAEPLTIAAMRERGIEAPAQAIYTLQLAGYQIDRVLVQPPRGRHASGYRLSPLSGGFPQEKHSDAT